MKTDNIILTLAYKLAMSMLGLVFTVINVYAQDLEPRAYTNAPVGMNFLLVGYQYSDGALLFDPSLPITDANAKVDLGFIGYVRTLDLASQSAKVGVILPYAFLSADGYVSGDYRKREIDGIADPVFYFNFNFYGAPALSVKEFKNFKQDTVIGFTFKLTAPFGAYEEDKLLNIGTNRWSFKPEFGISQAFGRWRLEGSAAAILYTNNDNFDNGSTRKQDPIYAMQGHLVYSFKNHIWAAVSATYYTGGRTSIDGVTKNDLQQNWRTGFTLALPITRNHSVKLFGNSGVSTRTGTDYDSLGIAWQYRWGEGF
jgi:hypothetical protein